VAASFDRPIPDTDRGLPLVLPAPPPARPPPKSTIRASGRSLPHNYGRGPLGASTSRIRSARWRTRRVSAGPAVARSGFDLFEPPGQHDDEGERTRFPLGRRQHHHLPGAAQAVAKASKPPGTRRGGPNWGRQSGPICG